MIRGELDAASRVRAMAVARRAVPMRWAALPVIATGAGHAR